MSRTPPEWIAKHDDQKVPPRVRQRVFESYNRTCYLSGRPIRSGDAWELEHIKALILGGEHRESNLAPALKEPHKEKTAAEMKVKAKIAAVAKKHSGVTRPAGKIKGQGFAKAQKPPRESKPNLPYRQLYRPEPQQ